MRGEFDTLADLAGRQQGRVAWRQLVAEGVDAKRIERWLRDGLLHPEHHGVYAVGHRAPSLLGEYASAVLACGDGAALSHLAAAFILRLLPGWTPPPVEVTVPTLAGRRRPGIRIHRVRTLHHRDTFRHENVPMTTAPRTLLDLAPSLAPPALARACHEAWVNHRVRPWMVEAVVARNPHKKGADRLRRALGADVTLSVMEDGFLALLRAHRLPTPRTNIDVSGDKVDCHWPARGLTIELLSYRYHGTRHAFEADVARRRRSNHVAFTYGDVFERGPRTAAEVARLLATRGFV